MKKNACPQTAFRFVIPLFLAAGLTACGGGGGGGGGEPPPALIDLTTANRDTVAHAAAVSFLAFGVTNAVPFTADSSAAALGVTARPQPAGQGFSLSSVSRRAVGLMLQSWGAERQILGNGVEHPLSVIGPSVEACQVDGTTTVSIDDRDNNGMMSVGDTFTFLFTNCRDTATETLNGTVTMVVTTIGATTLPSFSALMTFAQLSDVATGQRHSMTINGSAVLDYAQLNSTSDSLTVTASGSVVSDVYTHSFGNDKVTMQSGFVETSTYDASVPAPAGAVSTVPGRTTTTLAGSLQSAAAAGAVAVSTSGAGAALVSYNGDAYPRSGSLQIKGNRGQIQLTALSADQVKIDLDDNDDRVIESTRTDTWDWLL